MYIAENGFKWRALPKSYGNWHTIYVRINDGAKEGITMNLLSTTGKEHYPHQSRGALFGQYLGKTPSQRHGHFKKWKTDYWTVEMRTHNEDSYGYRN